MPVSEQSSLQFIFTPDGFYPDAELPLPGEQQALYERFEQDKEQVFYQMGLDRRPDRLSPSAAFLYQVSDAFFRCLTAQPDVELLREKAAPAPDEETLLRLLNAVPFAVGAEYITRDWLERAFARLGAVYAREIAAYKGTVELYLTERSQHLRVPERIFFHLVEHKNDAFPFAFLATYATRDDSGAVRHMPLQYALTEFGGQREKLLALLSCLNQAAEVSELVAGFMSSGELFHPLRLTAREAYAFLTQVEAIERAGILCRIPNWWKKRNMAVSLSFKLGETKPALLGFDALVEVQPELTADGVALSREDIQTLLAQTEGLALLKGKWVEVDHERLRSLLRQVENAPQNLTMLEALRMGLDDGDKRADVGPVVTNGAWLASLLSRLRRPATAETAPLPPTLRAELRSYQKTGYTWLSMMGELGFGACLADDMGLGKTVQALAWLEKLRTEKPSARALLIVPASLLGNWRSELEKFAPSMPFRLLHGRPSRVLTEELRETTAFLTMTTYGMAARIPALQDIQWDCVLLDEAQAIKNPLTKQTKAVKRMPARMRMAMTGTPVENDLTNLWSLFDFLNKGLLGGSEEFRRYCAGLEERPEGYARLRGIISPFLLRRTKTDKSIIADLPDKLETVDHVSLSKKQAVLYRQTIAGLEKSLREAEGIERRGLVLTAILKLKQICNHPDQYLGQTAFSPAESGKFAMLEQICATIYEKRERVLVFTQFREIIPGLEKFLTGVFRVKGRVLHGGTPVAKRAKIVEDFQGERYVPFLILSVKAGGTGLNLTKANHVIHFDRWWNPAVENQATDRAFRIGQTKDVMVHKLVCQGTVEEKIDAMIASKRELAEKVVGSGSEKWITELDDKALLSLLRLE